MMDVLARNRPEEVTDDRRKFAAQIVRQAWNAFLPKSSPSFFPHANI